MTEEQQAPRTPDQRRERVALLRAELARRGLDGFLIPRADAHQGEYVPDHDQRLSWLTGFTGSAGMAILHREHGAIFVDGRYTLAAKQQVDTELFEPHHLLEDPPKDWLSGHPGRYGFDPWLHTPNGLKILQEACQRAGGELIPCADNPLDAVWENQPPPPLAEVYPHPVEFSGEITEAKRQRIGEQLQEQNVDATVLTQPDSIAWLLDIRGGDVPCTPLPLSFAILHADGHVALFLDPRKEGPELREHLGNGATLYPPDRLAAELDELGIQEARVLLDHDSVPQWILERLQYGGARVVGGADPCLLPRACKNAVELAGARAAHRRDGVAVCRFLHWLAENAAEGELSEIQVAARLKAFRSATGVLRDVSFETISGAGPNGAIIHYRVTPETNRRLENGSLYLVDSGGQYLDGTTDITRTVAIGAPTAEYRDRYTRVLKGHIRLATVRFPEGTTGSQLDCLARLALWEVGLDYDHGTGHGVGSFLSVHEGPQRISKVASQAALRPGMIISNEPGYYKEGAYGIRIENLVVVSEAQEVPGGERPMMGFETLTLAPMDLSLVEPSLLAEDEREWLNHYHRRVNETIGPQLEPSAQAWLREATRPL